MTGIPTQNDSRNYIGKAIEVTVRLLILFLLFGWCFAIISPFLSPVVWGVIIAISIYPLFTSLKLKLKGRGKLAASILTLMMLLMVIIPSWMLADSLVEGTTHLREGYSDGRLVIPPPDDRVKEKRCAGTHAGSVSWISGRVYSKWFCGTFPWPGDPLRLQVYGRYCV